jgi:16S rRNA (adenine1518-N6/adenine1519-N6)-dimethyltransferase
MSRSRDPDAGSPAAGGVPPEGPADEGVAAEGVAVEGATVDAGARGPLALLRQFGLRPKRTLGQNFLADAGLCAKIARTVFPGAGAGVLEIGAGTGALTAPLLQLGAKVIAIETDRDLSRVLREAFAGPIQAGQLSVVEADAREVDLDALLGGLPVPRALAGNLPYHLSGLLLRRAVELTVPVERSVFLLQLEVVDRLCAAPGSESYGALSVFAQAVYAPERAFVVKRGAFFPQPNVDSAVVVLRPLMRPVALTDGFSRLVRAAFEKRRKTLRNAWRGVLGLEPPELDECASRAGIDLAKRGEVLAVADFERMAEAVAARGSA